jgi:hypothetical protein
MIDRKQPFHSESLPQLIGFQLGTRHVEDSCSHACMEGWESSGRLPHPCRGCTQMVVTLPTA